MENGEELLRRYDAAVEAAVETASAIPEWSGETRIAVALTIRLIGKEFARTLRLALASSPGGHDDPVAPEKLQAIEREWRRFGARPF